MEKYKQELEVLDKAILELEAKRNLISNELRDVNDDLDITRTKKVDLMTANIKGDEYVGRYFEDIGWEKAVFIISYNKVNSLFTVVLSDSKKCITGKLPLAFLCGKVNEITEKDFDKFYTRLKLD